MLAIYVLYQLQAIIVWTILALFLAVALSPPVNWLTRHGWPRTPSILIVYVVVLLVLSAIVALVLPALVTQVRQLASVLQQPGGLSAAIDRIASPLGLSGLVASWRPQLDRLPGQVATSLGSVGSLTTVTSGTIGSIAALLSVAVLGFFFMHDGAALVKSAVGLLPESQRPTAYRISNGSAEAISGYIRGNLAISLIAGVTVFVGMEVLGIPYALPLALLLAILDLIPMVGAQLGAVPVVLAALMISPLKAVIILAFIIVYSQIESNVLNPLVYGRRDQLPALTVFLAFLVGSILFGILGALIAIPVANIIRILFREWRASRMRDTLSSDADEADAN